MKKTDPRKVAYTEFDDPVEIDRLNTMLRRYFFIDYYDTSNITNVASDPEFTHIVSQYNSYSEYLKDKIKAKELIDIGAPIPKELEQRLLTVKSELEQANKFKVYGKI